MAARPLPLPETEQLQELKVRVVRLSELGGKLARPASGDAAEMVPAQARPAPQPPQPPRPAKVTRPTPQPPQPPRPTKVARPASGDAAETVSPRARPPPHPPHPPRPSPHPPRPSPQPPPAAAKRTAAPAVALPAEPEPQRRLLRLRRVVFGVGAV